jgi:transcriptional regulator with XRE-family HTH domain
LTVQKNCAYNKSTEKLNIEGGVQGMVVDNINAYIKENGIKQKIISDRSGINQCALSATLSKKRKLTADEYEKICIALKKEPNFFMQKNK